MIAGTLVDNFTSVGKKELEKDPIVGTMGKIMDAAHRPRRPKKAVEGLKKVEELRARGCRFSSLRGHASGHHGGRSVQEGTFPHRDAGEPDRADRDSQRRGRRRPRLEHVQPRRTVDVVVYPPIPIDDWTHDNLSSVPPRCDSFTRHTEGRPHDERSPELYMRKKALAKKAAPRLRPRLPSRKPPKRNRCRKRPPRKRRKRLLRKVGRENPRRPLRPVHRD
jgi:putative phosphoserine phosphatase/1-acylglycerol-3-phosphate O-acyltransferase